MKYLKIIKTISNISFGIGALLAAYALYTIIKTRSNLPPGVCPIDNSRPIIIISVVFLVISLITSFFTEKKKNK